MRVVKQALNEKNDAVHATTLLSSFADDVRVPFGLYLGQRSPTVMHTTCLQGLRKQYMKLHLNAGARGSVVG
jgi:hypothetical protein